MKVAIVGKYPRRPEHLRGGVEAVTLRLTEGLARMPDVEVHVVVSESDREPGTTRTASGVLVHSIGGARRLGNVLFQLPDRRRIATALRELRPDVVHAHSVQREALGAVESGLPAVVTIHGILEREIALEKRLGKRARGVFRRGLIGHAFSRVRNVIVLSPAVAEHYRRRLAHARVWTIENPVDDLFFDQDLEPDPDTALFSGLLIPRKGVRNLLEAFRIVREQCPRARLRVAGMAPMADYEHEVHETLSRLGQRDAVTFLGQLAPAELAVEYARAAFLVLVSKQETLPVAIQEAMAVGRPVIASPVGGIPDLVHDGDSGYLVPYGDPAALAARMRELLDDADRRASLGARARAVAEERFRVESVCRRTLDVYREVIARHRSGS